jgi:hypothetical protein
MIGPFEAALQVVDMSGVYAALVLFFFLVIIAIAVASRSWSSARGVQRPVFQDTSFPPPPPPDTVMVKCQYCGTQQVWKETCVKCGAPLPKPVVGGAAAP